MWIAVRTSCDGRRDDAAEAVAHHVNADVRRGLQAANERVHARLADGARAILHLPEGELPQRSEHAAEQRASQSEAGDLLAPLIRFLRIERLLFGEHLLHALRRTEKPRLEPCDPVAHPERPGVHPRQRDAVRLLGVVEHVGPIRGERQLEQRARVTAAGLDHREEGPRREVHPLERALHEVNHFPNEPVVLVLEQRPIDRQHLR